MNLVYKIINEKKNRFDNLLDVLTEHSNAILIHEMDKTYAVIQKIDVNRKLYMMRNKKLIDQECEFMNALTEL